MPGVAGPAGATGMPGPAGPAGATGMPGPTGPAGSAGASVNGACAAGSYVISIQAGVLTCGELTTSFAYRDADADGYGDAGSPVTLVGAMSPPAGFILDSTDCNDQNGQANPGVTLDELNDGVDNDCNGLFTVNVDLDGDFFTAGNTAEVASDPGIPLLPGDCDDIEFSINPAATDVADDAVDNDCNGLFTVRVDLDGDFFTAGNTAEVASDPGILLQEGDCDDTDSNVHPGAPEIAGDGIDNNCDGMSD